MPAIYVPYDMHLLSFDHQVDYPAVIISQRFLLYRLFLYLYLLPRLFLFPVQVSKSHPLVLLELFEVPKIKPAHGQFVASATCAHYNTQTS